MYSSRSQVSKTCRTSVYAGESGVQDQLHGAGRRSDQLVGQLRSRGELGLWHRIADVVDACLEQGEQPVPHDNEVGVASDGLGGVAAFFPFEGEIAR